MMPGENSEKRTLLSSGRYSTRGRQRWTVYLALFVVVAFVVTVIVLSVAIAVGVTGSNTTNSGSATYTSAAVAADAAACSTAGVSILKKGGSAVDAAIAAQLCTGVVNLHSAGIGGGGFMVFYNASSREATAIDFREVAAGNASTYMFNGTADDAHVVGGLSIAVPGEIRGFQLAWEKYGRLQWHELFEPAITLATEGVLISNAVDRAIQASKEKILSNKYPGLSDLLAPDGTLLKKGDKLKRPLLAQTLKNISEGADYLYNSSFTDEMVSELQEHGSILSHEDFKYYKAVEREVTRSEYKGHNVLGVSAPAGGPVLGLILNVMNEYQSVDDTGLFWHRVVEAMKFTYAQRLKLGDPAFNDTINEATSFMLNASVAKAMFERIDNNMTFAPEHYIDPFNTPLWAADDHGTSHLSVIAENGDAVAMTNSINNFFGSLVRSQKSGIIFNDEMADFSIPSKKGDFETTQANYIEPGKRPLSSMTPTIITDNEGVKMIVGASGGSRITTTVAQVILDVIGIQFNLSLSEAISQPRLHHQLIPNHISVEGTFPQDLIKSLESRGHVISVGGVNSVVQGIHVTDDGQLDATCDSRKGGQPDGYDIV